MLTEELIRATLRREKAANQSSAKTAPKTKRPRGGAKAEGQSIELNLS